MRIVQITIIWNGYDNGRIRSFSSTVNVPSPITTLGYQHLAGEYFQNQEIKLNDLIKADNGSFK